MINHVFHGNWKNLAINNSFTSSLNLTASFSLEASLWFVVSSFAVFVSIKELRLKGGSDDYIAVKIGRLLNTPCHCNSNN